MKEEAPMLFQRHEKENRPHDVCDPACRAAQIRDQQLTEAAKRLRV